MGYTKEAVHGVSWITLLRGLTRVLTFIRIAILGRLLNPTQFGYFGIASLLLALLEILTETGINVFIVQEKKHIKEYIDSAWLVSIIRGMILGFFIFVLAPVIAHYFNSPNATFIIMLMAIVPFIRGFINPAIITYQKDLLFHKEFRLRSILFFVDAFVSICVAFVTRDSISFVCGLIASALLEVTLSYILISFRPKISFQFQQIRQIITSGWWVNLTGIFSYFAENGDNITVGKILGAGSLGIYQVAYKFSTLPISEITNVVNMVIFPVYTRLLEDKERLWKAFMKVSLLSSLGGIMLSGAIFILAKPIILIFMGGQWVQAIPVVQVLALYGAIRTIFGNFAPLFLALGKQDYVAKMTFVRVAALLIAIIPLVMKFNMVGAGYAMLLSIFAEIPFILYFTFSVFKNKKLFKMKISL